jgi:prolyl-tRNA synthetase
MKLDKLVGNRFKERPSDCVIDSHALMVRGAYMKYVANGIFSSFTPLVRITQKIETIIREEMDAIDGQEVKFPVALPASLWEESGRYETVGSELLRFKDRSGSPMVLGMTHEEAAVQLVKDYGQTYAKYPFMIYQIQTKFRDEARPRGGLIRVREFTMKDAYSFHTSQADLESYYDRCHAAYERIFARAGVPEVVSVASDSGMMGGSLSHEFMLLTPIGEDSIALCGHCDYRSNVEAAVCTPQTTADAVSEPIQLVSTPNMHTIEEVSNFLNSPVEKSCKAVVYQQIADNRYVILFIRGDLEVNEAKLKNFLGAEIYPADITPESGMNPGFIGPYQFDTHGGSHIVCYDQSLKGANNLSCGGNVVDFHYTGLDVTRDLGDIAFGDFAKIADGDICPKCGQPTIRVSRGIEVGNIFQLGTKYTTAMDMQYVDEAGEPHYPIMGCYGIGVGRLAASVCEAHHDDYGPIWPMAIAPWHVHLCSVRSDTPEVKAAADALYQTLTRNGIEVIYDDRAVRPGVMFSDADLLGVPLRVVVSPRNLEADCVEIVSRDKRIQIKEPLGSAASKLIELISEMR